MFPAILFSLSKFRRAASAATVAAAISLSRALVLDSSFDVELHLYVRGVVRLNL